MDKNIYDIELTDLTYGMGYVYSLQYHSVWCTKYRKQILRNGVDTELKASLWGGHLWNPSYCAVTVSDRSREQVTRYIESQKVKG